MNSTPIYYEDTYRFSDQAVVESLGADDKGHYIVLDRTIVTSRKTMTNIKQN